MATRSGVGLTGPANPRRARSITSSCPDASARPVRYVSIASLSASMPLRGGNPMLAVFR